MQEEGGVSGKEEVEVEHLVDGGADAALQLHLQDLRVVRLDGRVQLGHLGGLIRRLHQNIGAVH